MPPVSLSLNDIISQSRQGRFHAVYFLHGDESRLTRQAVEVILECAVDKATADFNFDRFHGGDLNLEKLVTVLDTPPMMAPRRVVLLRDLEKAALPAKEFLSNWAVRPGSGTLLVLAAGERVRIDRKKASPKWAARLEEHAASALFWPLKEPELMRWLGWQAERRGKSLDSRASFELYARLGGDLDRLADEIEKLSVYCGARLEITRQDVLDLSAYQTGGTVFDWLDALAGGETLKAISLARHLLTAGESAVGALALATGHYTTLLKVRRMNAARIPAEQIKRSLGLAQRPPEAVKAVFAQAAARSQASLERALALLLEADRRLKTSSLPDNILLESLIIDFHREVNA
ncbi:DNA polymerase III subunit delta [bacterium]|nr:DNA polymerase III subunit delta [bacterium]